MEARSGLASFSLLLALAGGLAGCGNSSSAAPPPLQARPQTACPAGGVLYVIDGLDAHSEAVDGSWRLSVPVPTGRMVGFTDRPERRAARLDVAAFVARWRRNGFAADPPNVAVSGKSTDGAEIDVIAEMTRPAWNADTREFSALFRPIDGRPLPVGWDQVSLFIDDAQSSIQVDLTNLSQIPLSIQSITPDASTWDSSGGATQPAIGYDFGITSANGPSIELALTNLDGGAATVAEIILVGDYDNQWTLSLEWDADGSPHAELTQLSGTALTPLGLPPITAGVPMSLVNLSPDTGPSGMFQVVFDVE